MISLLTTRKRLTEQLASARLAHAYDKLRWRTIVDGWRQTVAALKDSLWRSEQRHKRQLAEAKAELDAAKAEIATLRTANEQQARLLHAQEDRLARAEGRPMLGLNNGGIVPQGRPLSPVLDEIRKRLGDADPGTYWPSSEIEPAKEETLTDGGQSGGP